MGTEARVCHNKSGNISGNKRHRSKSKKGEVATLEKFEFLGESKPPQHV